MSNFIKTFITAKIGSPMNLCDDHFAYNLDKLNFAVSDGASCNLASRIYSRLLVDHFAEHGEGMFSDEICNEVCSKWISETDKMITYKGNPYYLRNPFVTRAQAAATFAGMKIYRNEKKEWLWDSFVLGDSFLFFIPDGESCPNILYTTNKTDFSPDFSTNIVFNNNPKAAHPYNSQLWRSQVWEARNQKLDKGTFVLMTDALAEWFLCPKYKSVEDKLSMLMDIESDKDFLEFVDRESAVCLNDNYFPLHSDDITLMILHIDDLDSLSERESIIEAVKSDYRSVIEQCNRKEVFETETKEKEEIKQKYKDELDESRLQVQQLDKQLQEKNSKIVEQAQKLDMLNKEKEHNQEEIGKLRELHQANNSSNQHNDCFLISKKDLEIVIRDLYVREKQESAGVVVKEVSIVKDEQSNIKDCLVTMPDKLVGQLKNVIDEATDAFLQKYLKQREEEKNNNEGSQLHFQEEIDEFKKKNDLLINASHKLRMALFTIAAMSFVSLIAIIVILIMIVDLFC